MEGAFEISRRAAKRAVQTLSEETLLPDSLRPITFELDDYTCVRNTIAASAVAAWQLIRLRRGKGTIEEAAELVRRLERDHRLLFWGESASPHFFTIMWFLESVGGLAQAQDVLLRLIGALALRNSKLSDDPLDGPDVTPDEVLARLFQLAREKSPPRRGRRAVASWTLEAMIHIATRRGLRAGLAEMWSHITRVDLASFVPREPFDLLLWEGAEGEEATRIVGRPQSWKQLVAAAAASDIARLPSILSVDPEFAMLFALAYPHRNSTELIKLLDQSFGSAAM